MRLSLHGVLAGLLMLPSSVVLAQVEPLIGRAGHPIEHKMDSCMEEEGWAVQAMLECAMVAHADWQDEVERLGSRLAGRLGGDTRETFESAQGHWEVSRDAEFALIAAYYTDLQRADPASGDDVESLWPLAEQLRRNVVLEDRAYQLQRYLDGLEEMPRRQEGILGQ